MTTGRTYLDSEYRDKDKVKSLGARWDGAARRWYVPDGMALDAFRQWLPAVAAAGPADIPAPSPLGRDLATSDAKGVALSSLLQGVSSAIAAAYSSGVWTRVEVVKVDLRSGHVYLELAERTEDGEVLAQARAVIWKSVANSVVAKFTTATGAVLAAGIKLLVRAKPTLHTLYGLSLVIDGIDPSYTLGDLEAKKREIRRRLKQDGRYHRNRSLPPPWDYHQVLVIAPQGAAGLGDFRAEADRLDAAGICRFVYAFSRFQGEGAASEIRAVLLEAMVQWRARETSLPDAVAIIRGGGAVNDLAWLNDYDLARAICELEVPVLTGIGHERDQTILDEVANQKFDTPSKAIHGIEQMIWRRAIAARENYGLVLEAARAGVQRRRLAVETGVNVVRSAAQQQIASARERVLECRGEIRAGASRAVRRAADAAGAQAADLQRHARGHIGRARSRLPALATEVRIGAVAAVKEAARRSATSYSAVLERAAAELARARAEAGRQAADVATQARRSLADARANSEALIREVAGQGPEKTLSRGFAMVLAEGRPLTSAEAVGPDERIEIHFRDGRVRARTQDKEQN